MEPRHVLDLFDPAAIVILVWTAIAVVIIWLSEEEEGR